jgi:MarR family transcriptional regulator for hemolysin
MEEEGLIRRIRTKSDRRVHQVQLTPAGQKLFDKLKSRAEIFDRALTSAITVTELAALRASLDRVAEAAKRTARVVRAQGN